MKYALDILVTNNLKHFEKIEAVQAVNWAVE